MKEQILHDKGMVIRHGLVELAEHWLLALSGLVLIFSGLGELPMYKRFMITEIPGLSWAGDFLFNLKIHYLAAMVFVSVILFHVVYHGWLGHRGLLPQKGDLKASGQTILSFMGIGEEPKFHKYLPEQRLAYAYVGFVGLILVITGILKVLKNLPGFHLPAGLITWSTLIHTFAAVFFILGIVAHIAALVLKVNRPLVRSIFTGQARLDYVQNRHPLWYEELARESPMPPTQEAEPAAAEKMDEEGSPAEEGTGSSTSEKEKEDEKQAPSKEPDNKESSS